MCYDAARYVRPFHLHIGTALLCGEEIKGLSKEPGMDCGCWPMLTARASISSLVPSP